MSDHARSGWLGVRRARATRAERRDDEGGQGRGRERGRSVGTDQVVRISEVGSDSSEACGWMWIDGEVGLDMAVAVLR